MCFATNLFNQSPPFGVLIFFLLIIKKMYQYLFDRLIVWLIVWYKTCCTMYSIHGSLSIWLEVQFSVFKLLYNASLIYGGKIFAWYLFAKFIDKTFIFDLPPGVSSYVDTYICVFTCSVLSHFILPWPQMDLAIVQNVSYWSTIL